MLKIQFKDHRQEPFWIMEKTLSIGHAGKNHLRIEDPSVAVQHAKIINQGDSFLLKDLGSPGGTFVNGQRINQKHIACGDTIRFGEVELEVVDPVAQHANNGRAYWSLIADSSWLSGQEFPIVSEPGKVIVVGRGNDCDIVFPGTHLSRQHAEIFVNFDSINLRDLGSANGTFVNDRKISEAEVFPGDRVRFDVYSFRVFGPGIKLPRSATAVSKALSDTQVNRAIGAKQFKVKPTSVGNREELNLYRKQLAPLVVAGTVLLAILAAAVYVGLGISGAL